METKLISGGASLTWAVGMGKKERKKGKERDRGYVEKPNNEHNPTLTGRLALNSGSYTSETLSPSPPPFLTIMLTRIHPSTHHCPTFLYSRTVDL